MKESREAISADVIEINVSGSFKTRHDLWVAGGKLGTLQLNAGKSEGVFQGADGSVLIFKKTSFWKSSYHFEENGKVRDTAKSQKGLSRGLLVESGAKQYQLKPGGGKLRSWQMLDGEEKAICEIQPRGVFKRGAFLHVFAPVEVRLLVFGYCLVSRRWQEESAAA